MGNFARALEDGLADVLSIATNQPGQKNWLPLEGFRASGAFADRPAAK